MNLSNSIENAVHQHITDIDDPQNFATSLDDLFMAFMECDSGLANEPRTRIIIYGHYLNLKKFLKQLQEGE